MTKKQITQAEAMIEAERPAEGYSVISYEDGNLGLECRYPDITKIFWRLSDVFEWISQA